MATTIDELQIEINAKAQKANDAVDRLVGKLDRLTISLGRVNNTNLTGLANGVDRLGRAMRTMNTVKTADFTRLAKNISKMGTVNTQAINNTASSLTHITRAFNNLGTVSQNAQQVAVLASNLSKLGSASMQRAITNIPLLANAMTDLLTRLSQAPTVSASVINLTNALANLASQGAKVGSASKSVQNGLNRISSSSQRTVKHTNGLAYSFGKFYANFFLFIRGIKGIWKSIESTADYIEAYNYFNVALGKIGKDWSHQWEQYGYDSAEQYAESFTTRLNSKLQGMSGLKVQIGADGQGLLTTNNIKNLGVNIQELTQYASQLASVTNSIGQTGEVSLATASAFSKLGADMSSLFNVDYTDVMRNLQSGLIGQSRALYKYGIDITNATLQTKAYELGIQKAVSEMSQSEKQQLRIIQILEASKVAWGDLANTVSSPSNQIRILKTNLKETGMVLGQLFVPLLERVLPLFNALTLVAKDLLISLAQYAGLELNFEGFGKGFASDEAIDDMEESLEGAVDSLEDLKNQIMGFDEVNPLDSIKGSFDGISEGINLTAEILAKTEEYEKAWNEAYSKMQDKATEFANVIKGRFSGIGGAISNLGVALKNLDGLEFLGEGFGKGFTDTMDFLINDVGATAIDGVAVVLEALGLALDDVDSYVLEDLGEALGKATAAFLVYKTGSVALTAVENLVTHLKTLKSLGNIAVAVTVAITGFEVGKQINELITGEDAGDFSIWDFFGEVGWAIKNGTILTDVSKALDELWSDLPHFLKVSPLKMALQAYFDLFEGQRSWAIGKINGFKYVVAGMFDSAFKTFSWTIDIASGFTASFNVAIEAVKKIWNKFANWLNSRLTWDIKPVKVLGKTIFEGTTIDLGKIPTFQTGGFPEDGFFFANRNELVGKFSNGKTAVANNEQIIAGIEQGVYRAMTSALGSQSSGDIVITIDGKQIFRAVQREANNYTMQTGRSAFSV